jgi:hypothetical protein
MPQAECVMEVDGAAKNSGPTSSPSQSVIETAAHAAEAKDPPKNDARGTIDAAMEGAKAEKIPIRELISILPLEVHDDATGDACAEVILTEAKKGYGLVFLGLGAGSKETTRNLPPAIEKILREFAGPIAIPLDCRGSQCPF